jgi:ADP-glucose pyrophosphorylase
LTYLNTLSSCVQANQRRIWVAEQQHEEKLKRDAETNAQLKRELDM